MNLEFGLCKKDCRGCFQKHLYTGWAWDISDPLKVAEKLVTLPHNFNTISNWILSNRYKSESVTMFYAAFMLAKSRGFDP